MKSPIRNIRSIRALLALAVLASWLGGALFHNLGGALFHSHGAAAGPCKVCQVLQANPAALSSVAIPARPHITAERIAARSLVQSADDLLLVPQGRAPPLA